MNWRIIGALIAKDFSLFFGNRFFAFMTAFGTIVFFVLYFIMPSSVDESLDVGLYAPVTPSVFKQIQGEGLEMIEVETKEELIEGITENDYTAGIVLPTDVMVKFDAMEKPIINLYFASDTPDEIVEAVHTVITELSYLQTGQDLAVEISSEILGPDMLGMQIPPRDRMSPLFAILLVMIETIGLASLISEENEKGTIHALLVTPVSVKDIFISKGIIGIGLAFSQAALFLAIVGGLNSGPLIILIALFLGAVLATGVAFLVASLAKDFMSVIGWSMPTFIILTIPAFGILFPGTVSGWIKIIPSYYLADTVHQVARFGSGWSDVWYNLLILLGFDVVIICIGIVALGRKTR